MIFTSDKLVAVDFQEYAYTLIYAGVAVIALIGLVGMCIFIYVQFIK
jgi:hypothetical protein